MLLQYDNVIKDESVWGHTPDENNNQLQQHPRMM